MSRHALAALHLILAAAATSASAAQRAARAELPAGVKQALDRDDPVAALIAVQQALRRCGPEPSWTQACFDMPILAANVARRAGHYAQAWDYARQALRLARERRPEVSREMAQAYANLGFILQAWKGDPASAERYLRRALSIQRRLNGERHRDTASAYDELGMNLDAQRRFEESADLIVIALAIRQVDPGEADPATAISYNNVADVLARRGDLVRAESAYRHAFAVGARTLPDSHRLQVQRRLATAVILQLKDGPAAAYAEYDRAITASTRRSSVEAMAPNPQENPSIRRIFFLLAIKAAWDAGGAVAAPGVAAGSRTTP